MFMNGNGLANKLPRYMGRNIQTLLKLIVLYAE